MSNGSNVGPRGQMNLAEAYANEVQEEDKIALKMLAQDSEIKKLKGIQKLYDEALDCVDRVFQNKDCILPHFCHAGDDKFEKVVDLAKSYARLVELAEHVVGCYDDPDTMPHDVVKSYRELRDFLYGGER